MLKTGVSGSGARADRRKPDEGPGDEAPHQAAQLSQLHPGVLLTRGFRGQHNQPHTYLQYCSRVGEIRIDSLIISMRISPVFSHCKAF